MGRNADNHDVFPVSPTQISHNPDDEGVGLLDDEKQFAGYHDLGPSAHTTKKTWRNIAIISLAAHAFFGLAAMVAFVVYSQSSPRQHPLGELNGLVPEFPVRQMVFQEDPLATPNHKTAESANATADYWRSFMPIGGGFVHIDNHAEHNLPPPLEHGNSQRAYSISVFHQLHCLHTIMTMYNALTAALHPDEYHQPSGSARPGDAHRGRSHYHIDHCFRYLRQALVCCGDTALEGRNPGFDASDPDTAPVADGTGAVHVCRDYERIRRWAEERRVDDVWTN